MATLHQVDFTSSTLTNVEAEGAFLGAALIDNRVAREFAETLKPDDFHFPAHGRIYERLLHLLKSDATVTSLTLMPYFANDDGLRELGGASYLARLSGDGQGLLAPRELAEQIADLALRRRLRDRLNSAAQVVADLDISTEEVVAAAGAVFDPSEGAGSGRGTLPCVNFETWQGEPPPRESAWGTWLPLRQTTLLTGEGGVGKSLLAQQLCTCVALGLPFLGMVTEPMNTLYLTVEDDQDELWRRQAAICKALGISLTDLRGKLTIVSLAGEIDACLASFDNTGKLRPSQRWTNLRKTVRMDGIRVFAFDNASDLMAGDLNEVHQVAAFVNLLTGLAIERDGVSLLLHHPNKSGDEWSGSMAWHNKVRSRIIVKRDRDDVDRDARTIENPKANYGPNDGKIEFRWHNGAFIRDEDLEESTATQLRQVSAANGENAAFLACLRTRAAQGVERGVGPSPGPNYAPSQFEGMPEAKGYKKAVLKRAMDRLYGIGAIKSEAVRDRKAGRDKTVIVETEACDRDLAQRPAQRSHNTVAQRSATTAQRGTTHTVGTTYPMGGLHEVAPPMEELDWGEGDDEG